MQSILVRYDVALRDATHWYGTARYDITPYPHISRTAEHIRTVPAP